MERQQRLREHARKLIAETRAKSINLDSPSSPVKSITHRITLSPERTISPINNTMEFINNNSRENSPSKLVTRTSPSRTKNESLQSVTSVSDKISPRVNHYFNWMVKMAK